MKVTLLLVVAFIALFILLMAKMPHKQTANNLVMPGLLAKAHQKLESDCSQCHSAFQKGSQDALCMNCHKEVRDDMKTGAGFHGHSATVKEKQCRSCHTDHKGREFDIVHMDKETFDHHLTDYPLTGAHASAGISCASCHAAGKKYREAPKDCYSCHSVDDRHKERLGKDCARCHSEKVWNKTYFDHGKTHFPLEGKHKEAACKSCHANETYSNVATRCVACHLINDIHSAPEADCSKCHNAVGWKKISFDHNQETKFILKDRHVEAKCDACHKHNQFKGNAGSACADCHRIDDVHKGKNGSKCGDCHTSATWKKITFDHDRDTHFKLVGSHIKVQCSSCHKDSSGKTKIDPSCVSCHQADDVHKGQEGKKCETCHDQKGWKENIRFEHDLTHFPLIGLHAVVSCGECHSSTSFKDAHSDCISCHAANDKHQQALGTECARCHNPNGWKRWEFDHNTQAHYKLEGAHEGLQCAACHQKPMGKTVTLSSACVACHEQDDAHDGRFGERCEQCHTVESFKKIKVG